jgi:hypothetical protein
MERTIQALLTRAFMPWTGQAGTCASNPWPAGCRNNGWQTCRRLLIAGSG